MSANEGLQKVQSALVNSGVKDVKFFFKLDATAKPASEVKESVVRVLSQYLAGNYTPMGKLGDAEIVVTTN
jgi:hypothetical protein